jgi:hypothetical protein
MKQVMKEYNTKIEKLSVPHPSVPGRGILATADATGNNSF